MNRNFILLVFTSFLVLLAASHTYETRVEYKTDYLVSDTPSKYQVLIEMVNEGLQRSHYAPPAIDDEYSIKAFKLYLKRLDVNKKFLTQADVNKLKKYETLIDNEIKNSSVEFFNLSLELITKDVKEIEMLYKELLNKPFNYTIDETIELDFEKRDFSKTEDEREEYWRKSLKYSTLSMLTDKLEQQEKAKEKNDTTVELKSFEDMESDARKQVMKNYDNFFNNIDKLDKNDRFADFLNTLVNIYDPHSEYYPPKDKENFDIYISGQLEGIGAQLQQIDGQIKVSQIVSGSASWKQGQLKAGDIILAVAQENKDFVDVTDMRLDNAVQLIRGKKGTVVRLKVKTVDGYFVTIAIIRDVVILEETYAKSVILNYNIKAGYIMLPKFYMDMNQGGGRSCADDVKKEIDKLKAEGVEGIILDLRNNGGGSLNDAVKMAGFFIGEGPIVQVKARTGAPYILNDTDPAIYYGGPLIILVNTFSVSASEIVAAALQDYNRAVILGSNVTYGKGTVQRFLELDNYISGGAVDLKPLGSLKLSTQKFYRINGGATQLKGVAPDLALPDAYTYMDIGEKELDNYMPWDEIPPVLYTKSTVVTNLDNIKKNSETRIKQKEVFKLIEENAIRFKDQKNNTIYPLNIDKFREESDKITKETEKFKDIQKDTTGLGVEYIKLDYLMVKSDSAKLERAEDWHNNLKKDVYLMEAMEVLKDMYISITGRLPDGD